MFLDSSVQMFGGFVKGDFVNLVADYSEGRGDVRQPDKIKSGEGSRLSRKHRVS